VDPRPNWEPYKIWPGAYFGTGGTANSLRNAMAGKTIFPQDEDVFKQQEGEAAAYSRFRKEILPGHARYSQLGDVFVDAVAGLSQQLTILDFMRVGRIISSDTELYPLYREIFNGISRCESPSYYESPALKWLFFDFQTPAFYDYIGAPAAAWGPLGTTSNILTKFFEPLGVDTSDWSMDFGTGGRFSDFERFGTPKFTRAVFNFGWNMSVPDAGDYLSRSCDDLYAEGLKKIDTAYTDGTFEKIRAARLKPPATGPDILARCVKCHVDPIEGIPALPFDNLQALTAKLPQPFSKRGTFLDEITYRTSDMALQDEQMPRNRRLTFSERETFLAYLKTLTP
jgi:hypothetical protein